VPWADQLKTRPDVETFVLTRQNRESLTEMMTLYLQKVRSEARAGLPA